MFRVTMRKQIVGGDTFYHLRFHIFRVSQWRVCGVMTLDPPEWAEFLHLAEREQIEVVADEASV